MRNMVASAVVAALFACVPAHAQSSGASSALLDAATCVADNEPGTAARLLATLPGSPGERAMANEVAGIFAACAGYKISGAGARQALAVAMVARRVGTGAPHLGTASASPWYGPALAGRAPGADFDPVALGVQEFGTCVVAAAPDAATRLVVSMPGSTAERHAVAALRPVLAPCVVQGEPIRLTAANLRLMLAEPLYHAFGG